MQQYAQAANVILYQYGWQPRECSVHINGEHENGCLGTPYTALHVTEKGEQPKLLRREKATERVRMAKAEAVG